MQTNSINPSQLQQQLREQNKYEDLLDVFITFIIKRSPTIFILINMTLMIWLVQTIYSSHSGKIPRSIYFYSQFFEAEGLVNIYITDGDCGEMQVKQSLKTFPAIQDIHLKPISLYLWSDNKIKFCLEKLPQLPNSTLDCQSPSVLCSGYCMPDKKSCPITNIKRISLTDQMPKDFQLIQMLPQSSSMMHRLADLPFKYIVSRETKNQYVVGLNAQFQSRCANDYRLFDKFDNLTQYWNSTADCGAQGRVPVEIFQGFDQMPTQTFLTINGISSPTIPKDLKTSFTNIGMINTIKFNKKSPECIQAFSMSKTLKNTLTQDSMKPTFTQSMLIIAFVFFTVCWGWLLCFYCFDGLRKQKNMIVLLMCIIQLIVFCFLYFNNLQIFKTQDLITRIGDCIQTQIQATSEWAAWKTNSRPFQSIMYCCTSFLLMQIICHLMDRKMYVPYFTEEELHSSRVRREMTY